MHRHRIALALLASLPVLAASPAVRATATVGQPAPAFTLPDTAGKTRSLAEFKGRFVVLEWNNPECPFVQKHYRSGNMQSLQKTYTAENVAWLTINSTNEKHGEYKPPATYAQYARDSGAASTAFLLDADGTVGLAYGAKTTPHMYVIDPRGKLIYAGAIDDKRSTEVADVKGAKNFVAAALAEARAGKAVTTATTTPYGCSVKYS